MANLSRPPLSSSAAPRQILAREPALRPLVRVRRAAIVLAVIAALLGLAWIDGGEEPLHPIAEPVELPGASR
jgi:hypothetical protein